MSGYPGFDPYQQWLGIPPHEQPPHHYRLLGVPVFESNPSAISLAADRLLGYLGTVSDPAYMPLASRIYEEIVAARCTLADPYRKSQYDAWLQQQLYARQMMPGGNPGGLMPAALLGQLGHAPGFAPHGAGALPGMSLMPTMAQQFAAAPAQAPVPAVVETQIQDVGPNPYNMIYWGVGVLTLVIAVSLFRNMNDRKPARVIAQTKPASVSLESEGSEASIKVPPVPEASSETIPSEKTVPVPAEQPAPDEGEATQPAPMPVKREPRETPTTKKALPKPEVEKPELQKPDLQKSELAKSERKKVEPRKPESKKGDAKRDPFFSVNQPVDTSAGKELLNQVRLALGNRGLPQAKRHLEAVKALRLDPLNDEISRLEMLHHNLEQFWGAVRKGIAGLRQLDDVEIGKTRVSIVDAVGSKLILRIDGLNKTFEVDSMSAKMSLFLAGRFYKESPSANIFVGSFQAMDSMGDRQVARSLWEGARRSGDADEKRAVELLLPELDVAPPQGAQSVGTLGIE